MKRETSALGACLLIGALISASPVLAADIVGRASVVDGDTIDIHGIRVRFDGIDAPESRQICLDSRNRRYQCGQLSANKLDAFLSTSQPIACRPTGRSYERIVAICRRADGTDVSGWLVRNGLAVDWPKYSQGRYAEEQKKAQTGRLGIWSGRFEMPCQVRGAKC